MIDAVIIGSGFGGAVTACRLAAAGRSVVVLERGKRWSAPEFPRSTGEVADAFWHRDRSYGFLEYLAFRRFDVIQGAGVGGGSLHYFNVNLPAPRQVFHDPAWPDVFRRISLEPFHDAARAVLGSAPLTPPAGRDLPDRTRAFLASAHRAGHQASLVPIAVHADQGRADPHRPYGIQQPCTYCGNCLFGCNDDAKNTLDRNYLALAERDGAEIRPLHLVDGIREHPDGGFEVGYSVLPDEPGTPPEPGSIRSRQVIVAAGSLGSTELLLRCRTEQHTLTRISPALGTRFSLNGELLLAYGKDLSTLTNPGLGPPITARVTASEGDTVVTVQDLGLPDSLLWFLEGALPPPFHRIKRLAATAYDYVSRSHGRGASSIRLDALLSGTRTTRAMPYLGMGNDSSDGTMALRGGELDVSWSPRRNRGMYRLMERTMREISAGGGGRFVSSPLGRWPLRKALTAHPLGGCPMGDDPRTSVVDDRGAVHGHEGLFVVDGSIVPSALVVNPSLTIAALAERAAAAIIDPTVRPDDLEPVLP